MITEIFPEDSAQVVWHKLQHAEDEVRVHHRTKAYDIGKRTIEVTKKNLTIIGLNPDGSEADPNKPGAKLPTIRGTSAHLMKAGEEAKDCGIFWIGPGSYVEMRGLQLIHEIPQYQSDATLGHGSTTIANLVDNTLKSCLIVANCLIKTNATTAISVRSNKPAGTVPPKNAVNQIKVSGSYVTGQRNKGLLAGNYSSVNLGDWGAAPLDMRNTSVEIAGCTLKSLVFGPMVANVLADSNSEFLITNNVVGPAALGVFCGCLSADGGPVILPMGHINVLKNTVKIERYLDLPENPGELNFGAAGILVRVSSVPGKDQTVTTIKGNEIEMLWLPSASPGQYKYIEPIVYELVPPTAGPIEGVTANIDNNKVLLKAA